MASGKHVKTSNNNIASSSSASIAKSTIAMSIATLSSRFTGLLRTWMMAVALGNTVITSAYQVANNMSNFIFDFIAGGLLGAAFIPIFMQEKEKYGQNGANIFSSNILNITIVFLGALSILATIFSPQVIATQTFTVGQQAQVSETAIIFFRIFAIQIMFYGIGGVINAILNGQRIYFVPAFAPALNNIIVIVSFVLYFTISPTDQYLAIYVLGIGTTLGVFIQCIAQIPSLIKCGFKWYPIFDLKDPALFAALKIAFPTFVYIIGNLIAFTCRNAFSLEIADNGPATILYAWMWYQLPYGVIAVSLSRTMFTEMSDSVAKNNHKQLNKQVSSGLSLTLIFIIPLAVLMFAFATPLMSLFKAGNFNVEDVYNVSTILRFWVVSLPFYSVLMYLYNVYAAIKKFTTFAIVSCSLVVLQCFMYWLFCQPKFFLLLGIPITDFLYYFLCCTILLIILKTKIGKFGIFKILFSSIKITIASIIGALLGYSITTLINFREVSMITGISELVLCGGISLILIIILSYIFRVREIKNTIDKLIAKFKNR